MSGVSTEAVREWIDYVERVSNNSNESLAVTSKLMQSRLVGYEYGLTDDDMSCVDWSKYEEI